MSNQNPLIASKLVGAIDATAADPSISFGGSVINSSGTGIRGDLAGMTFSVGGADVLELDSTGIVGLEASVLATPLTGLAAGTDAPIADTDTILEALAKLQAQIDAIAP